MHQSKRQEDKKSMPSTTQAPKAARGAPTPKVAKPSLEKAYGTTSTTTTKPNKGPGKSSIVAATKASYAEKYGTLSKTEDISTNKLGVGRSGAAMKPATVVGTKGQKATTTNRTTMDKGSRSTSQVNPSLPKSNAKPPNVKVDKPELKETKEPEEDNYDDDFEEDYKSDFEEEPGSDSEVSENAPESEIKNDDELHSNEEESGIDGQQGPDFSDSSETEKEIEVQNLVPSNPSGFFQRRSSIDAKNNYQQVAERPYASGIITTENDQGPVADKKKYEQKVQENVVSNQGFNFDTAKKDSKLIRSRQLKNIVSLQNSHSVTLFHLDTNQDQIVFSISGTIHLNKETQVEKPQENHDTQTISVEQANKWTQRPPTWSTNKAQQLDIKILREESLGVGTESVTDLISRVPLEDKLRKTNESNKKRDKIAHSQMEWDYDVGSSWSKISNFISRASGKMLYVLESQKRLGLRNNKDVEGSISEAKLGRGLPVFNSLEMACLTCSGDFLACANYYPIEKSRRKNEAKSVVTIWSMKEPSCPKWFLRMWGKVTAISLFVYGHVAVAGGKDGGLAIWDLDENPDYHKAYQDQTIRTATIDTAMLEHSHHDVIVGLQVFQQTEHNSVMLSIDRSGILKTWSLNRSKDIVKNPHYRLHTACWSRLNLCFKSFIDLNECLAERLLLISSVIFPSAVVGDRIKHIICGTVNGFAFRTSLLKLKKDEAIVREYYKNSSPQINGHQLDLKHGDTKDLSNGQHENLVKEIPEDLIATKQLVIQKYNHSEIKSTVTAMDVIASELLHLCLVGSGDGKCRLYSLPNRRLLLTINCGTPPLRVHFSRKRLSVLYIAVFNTIHVYDLLKSESKPWKTISIPNILDLEIYLSVSTEFAVVLANNELKASMICGDVLALSEQDYKKFAARLDALLSS